MDVLSQLLAPVEVRGSVFCHGPVCAPWRFEGGAPGRCLFHCVVEGGAWMTIPKGTPTRLQAGDVVLIPRGGKHQLGSKPRGSAVALGKAVGARSVDAPFVRFKIGGDGPRSVLICGDFEVDGMQWHPLLRALPDVVIVNAGIGRWLSQTLAALERYVDGHEAGAALVTERLAEILFVQCLGAWLSGEDVPPGWLRALRDESIGRALGLMHARPAEPWTVPRLAKAAGMSRSAFFGRFKALVGEPPASYLKDLRMTLAAKALGRDGLSVAETCARIGYTSVPSFAHAFRKHHGQTPAAYRRANADEASLGRAP